MIDHLDRITNLGFDVNLTWNKSIEITYYLEDNPNPNELDIRVLYCMYDSFSEPSFEDILETTCDFFYMWYNRNLELLKDWELSNKSEYYDKLTDSCLGDITQQVYRDFNIDSLLG